jgi:hypothetical protein
MRLSVPACCLLLGIMIGAKLGWHKSHLLLPAACQALAECESDQQTYESN